MHFSTRIKNFSKEKFNYRRDLNRAHIILKQLHYGQPQVGVQMMHKFSHKCRAYFQEKLQIVYPRFLMHPGLLPVLMEVPCQEENMSVSIFKGSYLLQKLLYLNYASFLIKGTDGIKYLLLLIREALWNSRMFPDLKRDRETASPRMPVLSQDWE